MTKEEAKLAAHYEATLTALRNELRTARMGGVRWSDVERLLRLLREARDWIQASADRWVAGKPDKILGVPGISERLSAELGEKR